MIQRQEIKIILREDGKMDVTGPLEDKLLCYGMLVAAKDIVASFKGPAAGIIPASSLPNGNGNGNKT